MRNEKYYVYTTYTQNLNTSRKCGARSDSLKKIRVLQLGDEWPSPVGKTHKHSLHNTGEASDSCEFLGQRHYCTPVVHAWCTVLAWQPLPHLVTMYTL